MKVFEIFSSIEGEGIRAGQLCTFIRLSGCNLNCSYCDTKYAMTTEAGTHMSVQEIVDEVDAICSSTNVTLTGGEPLWRCSKELRSLLEELVARGYEVNVETNGSIDVTPYMDPDVFFTVDYKSTSSGMTHKMLTDMFCKLREQDVVKFVVGSKQDLDEARAFCNANGIRARVYVSPVFGQIELADIVEYMKRHMLNWTLQVQLHKIIWDPEMRGV